MEELKMMKDVVEYNIILVEKEITKSWNPAQKHALQALLKTHQNYLNYINNRF